MAAVNRKLARGVLSALVVGALGFGASAALASPVQAASHWGSCNEEEEQICQNFCAPTGGQGRCTNFGVWDCQCVDN